MNWISDNDWIVEVILIAAMQWAYVFYLEKKGGHDGDR